MSDELKNKRTAVLVADGFEQVEMTEPRKALEQAGATVEIVSPMKDQVRGMHHDQPGDSFPVDVPLGEADAENYDSLVLPGGVMNPDTLRMNSQAVEFVRAFGEAGKPIAAICHGPWTLIDAGLVAGRRITSWPSLKTDLRNAGADWVDEKVVVDHGLVTSRKPDDLPAFNRTMIEEFQEGNHGPGLTENARDQEEAGAEASAGETPAEGDNTMVQEGAEEIATVSGSDAERGDEDQIAKRKSGRAKGARDTKRNHQPRRSTETKSSPSMKTSRTNKGSGECKSNGSAKAVRGTKKSSSSRRSGKSR
jgi:protease I